MLSTEENELLTQVNAGTPMGELMRRYWIPVVESSELEAGGRVKRVKLLGEDLIALRAPDGTVGLVGEYCPHRWASLYFGRNEAEGLRCVYHGWKFAQDGQCLDMPNEPQESEFKDKVKHIAYPCAERGGVVWTYMGPASDTPELPDLEWALVPHGQRFVSKFYQECNYIQGLEGGIDPSHISFLHASLNPNDEAQMESLEKAEAGFGFAANLERAPHIEVSDTDYGILLGARRQADPGMYYWRITQFHMPFYTMPPTETKPEPLRHLHIWVPVDDHNVINWCVSWHPTREITDAEREAFEAGMSIHILDYEPASNEAYGDIRPRANRTNDYLMDWEVHRTEKFLGVPGVGSQDKVITESQHPNHRMVERLGRSDIGIIRVRKYLLDAAVALDQHGTEPAGRDAASHKIRPASVLLPHDVIWTDGAKEDLVARV